MATVFGRYIYIYIYIYIYVCVCVTEPTKIVGMHVCVYPCPRLLIITSGVMWRDMDLICLVKPVLQLLYGYCGHYH